MPWLKCHFFGGVNVSTFEVSIFSCFFLILLFLLFVPVTFVKLHPLILSWYFIPKKKKKKKKNPEEHCLKRRHLIN